MNTRIYRADARLSDSDTAEIVEILQTGGTIVYPTETVYGIGCDALNKNAAERIRRIKGREEQKPFLVLLPNAAMLEKLADPLTPAARTLGSAFWPGPVTLIVQTAPGYFPDSVSGGCSTAGFRVTPHICAAQIVTAFSKPLVSTSANAAGEEPVYSGSDAISAFHSCVDAIIDGGVCGGLPSTVVDTTVWPVRVLRQGAVPEEEIKACAGENMV